MSRSSAYVRQGLPFPQLWHTKHGTNLGLGDGCGEIIRKYMDYHTGYTTPIPSHFEFPEMTNATPILHSALPSEGGTFPCLQGKCHLSNSTSLANIGNAVDDQ